MANSSLSLSGSDQTRSAIGPSCGISAAGGKADERPSVNDRAQAQRAADGSRDAPLKRSMILIWSMPCTLGLRPAGSQAETRVSQALLGQERGRSARGRTAVDAEDAVVDDDRQRQKVEHVGEVGPNGSRAVLALALGVESVRLPVGAREEQAGGQSWRARAKPSRSSRRSSCPLPPISSACPLRQDPVPPLRPPEHRPRAMRKTGRTCVTARLSWLPRISCTRSGYRSLRHVSRLMVSTENRPRST